MAKLKKEDRDALALWEKEVEAIRNSADVNPNESVTEIAARKGRLEADDEAWFAYYFDAYYRSEPAHFHKRATKRLMSNDRWYEVRAGSRELAKAARAMMEIGKLALMGKIKNVLLISNSADNAERLLLPFMVNFAENRRIIQDYGKQPVLGQWEAGEFVIKAGCSFRAIGAGQSPRGTRNKNYRADFILIDDIDTDKECRNPDLIEEKWKWLENALIPTMSVSGNYRVLFNGNIIAKDCCISRAIAKAKKIARSGHVDIINIRDKHGRSSWPAKNSEEDIDTFLSLVSEAAAQREFFNNPLSEGDVFKEMVWGDCPPLGRFPFVVAYADPSPSNAKNKNSSFKALFLLGYFDGKFYVLNGRLDHVTNEEFVGWFYEMRDYVADRTQVHYYIENNKLQDPFYEQVFMPLFAKLGQERGFIGVMPDERRKPEKFDRIEGNLQPMNRQGRLILNAKERNNPHMTRLEEQFKLINRQMKSPADGPDCVEGGWFIVNQKLATMTATAVSIGARVTNKRSTASLSQTSRAQPKLELCRGELAALFGRKEYNYVVYHSTRTRDSLASEKTSRPSVAPTKLRYSPPSMRHSKRRRAISGLTTPKPYLRPKGANDTLCFCSLSRILRCGILSTIAISREQSQTPFELCRGEQSTAEGEPLQRGH